MKLVKLLLFTIALSTCLGAQSTERFIRIVGNAKKEIQASKAQVYFTVSEVKESTYNKTEAKTYDTVYDEVVTAFADIGIEATAVQRVFSSGSSYRRNTSNNFLVEVDLQQEEKVKSISVPGLQMSKSQYLFEKEDVMLETELSLQALKDAKRKAKAICDDIEMKLGKILNIEVKEGNRTTNAGKDKIKMATYRVTITFKLVE